VMMVTHDVDEAVLLSDRIVMMTNGPAATIGEVHQVPLPPIREQFRARLEMAHNPDYLHSREAVLEFLYHKQAHVERDAA
jgi:nitrate/nitrite transport system ATP-binding protein